MSKILRPSVMRHSEWWKQEERDPLEWKAIKDAAKKRDNYTCVYCDFRALKWMQVNHVGAEDSHDLTNLETVCNPCHSVLHIGANCSEGIMSVIYSDADQVRIVNYTRRLLLSGATWSQVEKLVLEKALKPGTKPLDAEESVEWANTILEEIPDGEYRGYLPAGMAVIFHQAEAWKDYPELVWRWGGRGISQR